MGKQIQRQQIEVWHTHYMLQRHVYRSFQGHESFTNAYKSPVSIVWSQIPIVGYDSFAVLQYDIETPIIIKQQGF